MKPLRNRLQDIVQTTGSQQSIVEKDYLLSYILAGLASVDVLRETLVFKGGTALKKCYFGDYRFSEDLDFSASNAPQGELLDTHIQAACHHAKSLLSEYGPFQVVIKRHLERDPHPGGQEAFDIYGQFPWHPNPMCRIKVEITHDEPVILPPVERQVIHGYEESLSTRLPCYSLEEIVAEKLRSLLQTNQRLQTRGWSRPRSRDYYDLWNILEVYHGEMDLDRVKTILPQKCQHRQVTYGHLDDFFTPRLLEEVEKHWNRSLSGYVRDLPESHGLLASLKEKLLPILQ